MSERTYVKQRKSERMSGWTDDLSIIRLIERTDGHACRRADGRTDRKQTDAAYANEQTNEWTTK